MTTYRWPSQTIASFVTISTANDRTNITIYIKSKLTARLKCYLPRGWSGSLEFFLAEPLAIGHAACFFSRFAGKGDFLSLQRPFLIPALAASRPAVCTQACQGLRACNVYTIEQRLSNDRLGQVVLLFLTSKLLRRFNILSTLARQYLWFELERTTLLRNRFTYTWPCFVPFSMLLKLGIMLP